MQTDVVSPVRTIVEYFHLSHPCFQFVSAEDVLQTSLTIRVRISVRTWLGLYYN